MLGRDPVIKQNKHAVDFGQCYICGQVIMDASGTIFAGSERLIQQHVRSKKAANLCRACAGEECPQNYKHRTTLLEDGTHYCKQCRRVVEYTQAYRSHMKENDIKVDEAQIIDP